MIMGRCQNGSSDSLWATHVLEVRTNCSSFGSTMWGFAISKATKAIVLKDLRQLRILDKGMQIPENTDDITKLGSIELAIQADDCNDYIIVHRASQGPIPWLQPPRCGNKQTSMVYPH